MEDEKQELKADPLHEMRERFTYATDAWDDNRNRYKEDVEFLNGSQWPDGIQKERDNAGQPCLVVDKLNQYVRQVVNDSRQNRPSIKVRPVDSEADIETAEIMQGLCRHIEDRSDASAAYDTSIESAVKGGFGFIRILTEYAHENTFEQEVCIERVRNPLSVLIDPDCKKADFSDARYCFVIDEIDEDDLEKQYPDADAKDFDTGDLSWQTEDGKVVIAEYFEVINKTRTMHMLTDGTVVSDEEYQTALIEGLVPPDIKDTREIDYNEIMWSKVHGGGYLEKPTKWIGKYIPIVPVIGNEVDIDGKVSYVSLIHAAKDAQRLYNYSRSAFAERVALAPKSPYIAAAGQIENHPEWNDANSVNYSVLTYDPQEIGGALIGAPQRQPASDIPAGFSQDMQLSEHDIQASLGMYSASLGQQGNEKSGRAIMARQREGDTGTFHYHDNLSRSIRYVGKILIDLIPKVYDSKRVVRILGVDSTSDMVQLDPNQPQASMKINTEGGVKSIYNLNMGTYDVSVSTGPSYTTQRQEAAEAMIQLSQANPQLMQIAGDLMIRNMDWPGAEEIADRLKLMLPPQIAQAEQDEEGQSPEVQAIMAQAQQAMQERDMQIQQAEQMIQQLGQELQQLKMANDDKIMNAQSKQADTQIKAKELEIKAFQAETERMVATQGENSSIEAQIKAESDMQVASLNAAKDIEIARINAQSSLMQSIQAKEESIQPDQSDMENKAMMTAILATQAKLLQAISSPKKIDRDINGRITVITPIGGNE